MYLFRPHARGALTARHLEKAFPARPLFADVTVHVEVGDRIGLIGPNGAGKSTLLKVLAGLDEADAGEILVPRGTRTVYVGQMDDHPMDASPIEIVGAAMANDDASDRPTPNTGLVSRSRSWASPRRCKKPPSVCFRGAGVSVCLWRRDRPRTRPAVPG